MRLIKINFIKEFDYSDNNRKSIDCLNEEDFGKSFFKLNEINKHSAYINIEQICSISEIFDRYIHGENSGWHRAFYIELLNGTTYWIYSDNAQYNQINVLLEDYPTSNKRRQ